MIEPDSDSTIAIYGKDESFRKILLGEVAAPASAAPFMAAVQHASHKARQHEAKEEVKDDKK